MRSQGLPREPLLGYYQNQHCQETGARPSRPSPISGRPPRCYSVSTTLRTAWDLWLAALRVRSTPPAPVPARRSSFARSSPKDVRLSNSRPNDLARAASASSRPDRPSCHAAPRTPRGQLLSRPRYCVSRTAGTTTRPCSPRTTCQASCSFSLPLRISPPFLVPHSSLLALRSSPPVSPGQRRLHDIGSVHAARGAAHVRHLSLCHRDFSIFIVHHLFGRPDAHGRESFPSVHGVQSLFCPGVGEVSEVQRHDDVCSRDRRVCRMPGIECLSGRDYAVLDVQPCEPRDFRVFCVQHCKLVEKRKEL
jgi:hypothetical protein